MREVISGVESRALVKILGGGKLGGVSKGIAVYVWDGLTGELLLTRRRARFVRGVVLGGTLWKTQLWCCQTQE
jgi:hypothetical protein